MNILFSLLCAACILAFFRAVKRLCMHILQKKTPKAAPRTA